MLAKQNAKNRHFVLTWLYNEEEIENLSTSKKVNDPSRVNESNLFLFFTLGVTSYLAVLVFVLTNFVISSDRFLKVSESFAQESGIVRGQPNDLWADVVIGQPGFSEGMPKERSATKVFNPGGVLVDRSVKPNRVYVSDGGNSRILAYSSLGQCSGNSGIACTDDTDCTGLGSCQLATGKPADFVLGQPDFVHGACNGDSNFQNYPNRTPANAASLCTMPQGQISPSEGGALLSMATDANHNLYVPDWLNNRVLMYKDPLGESVNGAGDAVADAVWGQVDFSSNDCNRGNVSTPGANTLCLGTETSYNPAFSIGVDVDVNGNLWVADTLNSRVLRFPYNSNLGRPSDNADLALGQINLTSRSGSPNPSLAKMWLPGAVKVHPTTGDVYVLDTYNDDDGDGTLGRVLLFQGALTNGMLGQKWGDPSKPFNLPVGIEFSLDGQGVWVSDFYNHLVLLYDLTGTTIQSVLYNDHWTTSGLTPNLTCPRPFEYCYQHDTRGSIGVTSAGDLLLSGSSAHQGVLRFKAPIPTPQPNVLVAADHRMFYPPSHFNLFSGRTFWAPMGIEAVGNQLIVADNTRLMFWNNADTLTNNWPVATGIVGSNDPAYSDISGYTRIRADKSGHLFVIHNDKIQVYNLPLIGGVTNGVPNDVPIKELGLNLQDLNGNPVTITGNYNIGGLYPADDASYLWVAHNLTNRAIRIRNPLSSNPRVDVILGQLNSSATLCNRGGARSSSTLCEPGAVRMDNLGNLYISDGALENNGNMRLLKFTPDQIATNNAQMIYAPFAAGIYLHNGTSGSNSLEPAFSFDNKLVVGYNPYSKVNATHSLEYFNDIDSMGWQNPTGVFSDYLSFPYAMDFDEQGNLYVADMNRGRVLKYFTPFAIGTTPTSVPTETPVPTATNTPTPSPSPSPTNTSTPTPTLASTNLIKNSGFELDANNNGVLDNWTDNSRFTRSSTLKYSGNYSGKHFSSSNSSHNVSQTITGITGNRSYAFSGWTNIPSTYDSFTYKIQLIWRSSGGSTIKTDTIKTYTSSTSGWNNANSTRTSPSNARSVIVRMDVSSLKASIYADEFSLKQN